MLYKIYIGSNNDTKKLESKKAIMIASKHFDGFSVSKITGYWKGRKESTLIIEIETDSKKKIMSLALELKEELLQEAIAVAKIGKMQFV